MPLTISLINMPFADLCIPSIALTQLKSVIDGAYGKRVTTRIIYLNHEFGRFFGTQTYDYLAKSSVGHISGLGEWLFRSVAFPDLSDNKAAYFSRYAHQFDRRTLAEFEQKIEPLRAQLGQFLDSLILRYRIHESGLVGLTSMFFQNIPNIALAKRLRQIAPQQTIVMGGANCESTMGVELVTNVPEIDFAFSGHALLSFPQFVGHLLDDEKDKCHAIDGVFSRNNSKSIAAIADASVDIDWGKFKVSTQLTGIGALGREQDINETPDLNYDTFFQSLCYILPTLSDKARIGFETSRGCWWGERAHCTFCGLNGGTMTYRSMHADRAIQYMEQLFKRYGERTRFFDSVDNILPREYFTDVFPRMRVPDHISLFYEVKSDLSEDDVRALAHSHVDRIQPGIEALATSTLKLMRKGTTVFHGLQLLKHCKKYGISPFWNLLVGFPGELANVYSTYMEMLPSLFHLPPPQGVFPIRFDRFSPYFTLEREYKLKLAPYDYYALCYPFPALALRNMAYYFQDQNIEAQYSSDLAASVMELRDLVKQWQGAWSRQELPSLDLQVDDRAIRISDSRPVIASRYEIHPDTSALLQATKSPVRVEDLPADSATQLDDALKNRLVFTERGRVMSLVA